jgi:hypothetical protein
MQLACVRVSVQGRTPAITTRREKSDHDARQRTPLWASRAVPLDLRLTFVFPVATWFPVVVSQYLNPGQLGSAPSQNRTCAVNASGSSPTPRTVRALLADPGALVRPALCPANARFVPRVGVAAFPPPELPGFHGTMQRSDFPAAICLPRLFDLSGILVLANKSRWDLTGCLADIMCNANGPSTPGLRQSLAMTRLPVLPSSLDIPWAGSESYKISGLNTVHGWTASPVHSSSLPFCVRFNAAVARRAATLDTGPVASSYPRGVSTRLSTNHFQSARPSRC